MSAQRFLYGFHAVAARLKRQPESILEIFLAEGRSDVRARELLVAAEQEGVRLVRVQPGRLDGMVGDARHQGVVARVAALARAHSLEEVLKDQRAPALILVLDGVQDPHNLGACLRVADAAGANAVIAPKDRAVGLNAVAAKVSSGASETVPYLTVTNLARTLHELQERGIWVIGADQAAERNLYQVRLDGPIAWVLGAEGGGLRRLTRETCDELARIPMLGTVESLNVSVAAAVCLFEANRQRGGGGRSGVRPD